MSHTRAVSSSLPLASCRPSGEKAMLWMGFWSGVSATLSTASAVVLPAITAHTLAWPSACAQATRRPSALKATWVTRVAGTEAMTCRPSTSTRLSRLRSLRTSCLKSGDKACSTCPGAGVMLARGLPLAMAHSRMPCALRVARRWPSGLNCRPATLPLSTTCSVWRRLPLVASYTSACLAPPMASSLPSGE